MDDDRGDAQHVLTGQMYVEQLLPVGGVKHPWPLVFIHGAGQTGTVSSNSALCLRIPVGPLSSLLRETMKNTGMWIEILSLFSYVQM